MSSLFFYSVLLFKLKIQQSKSRCGHQHKSDHAGDVRPAAVGELAHDGFVVGDVQDDGDHDRRGDAVENRRIQQRIDRGDTQKMQQ